MLEFRRLAIAALICMLSYSYAGDSQARTLYWPSLSVHLRIDPDGALHIVERHTMMFDGDWNGGERTFQLRSWQSLHLASLTEVLPETDARIPLVAGDLDAVNEYRLDGRALRWRSRLPTDPPFSNTRKIYEIAYRIEGALLREDDVYVLNHDLAFPQRTAPIENFEAKIELSPEWHAADLPQIIRRQNLQPGESVFITARLDHVGAREPAAVASAAISGSRTALPLVRYGSVAMLLVFVLFRVRAWLRRERALGRFEPPVPSSEIDEQWLATHVFALRPEVVGATWDLNTSSAEVAALIARLIQEGKLSSNVTRIGRGPFMRDILQLKLLCSRDEFASYERKLIDRLFFDGIDTVDTDQIRAHYKSKGFDPAKLIDAPIRQKVPSVFKRRGSAHGWSIAVTTLALLGGSVILILSWIRAPDLALATVLSVIGLFVLLIIGLVFAYTYRVSVHDLKGRALRTLLAPTLIWLALTWILLAAPFPLLTLQLLALPLLALGVLNWIFDISYSRDTPDSLRLRRNLGSARQYFERELARERPRLKDEWFPYLLAFGLGPKVDKWFKAFGTTTSSHGGVGTAPGPSSHYSASSSSWTGGGGTFGGAGASGSWAGAIAGVAAGVPSPSSSGGSSGGGGSSSSGGGGGGGW